MPMLNWGYTPSPVSVPRMIVAGTLFVAENIEHIGDPDTDIQFSADRIKINVGGVGFIEAFEKTQNELIFNTGNIDVDLLFKNDTDTTMTIDGSTSPFVAIHKDLQIAEKIVHEGDPDTDIQFSADRIKINVGGVGFIDAFEKTQNELIFNTGNRDVDVLFKNDTDITMTIDGSTSPFVKIHTPHPLILEPTATGNLPAGPVGSIMYDSTLDKLVVYNGAAWEAITSST